MIAAADAMFGFESALPADTRPNGSIYRSLSSIRICSGA
jgi:hypothetical protein